MGQFDEKLSNFQAFFETKLNNFLDEYLINTDEILRNGIRYAILDGGKRIRPILVFATAELLQKPVEDVVNLALSIEMIHSYSLVHDDLPSMDNDDYRRGKFSTHKKFGEANGILIGDSLLNLAFESYLFKSNFDTDDAKALKIIGQCSGLNGMILGQIIDLKSENCQNSVDKDTLYKIYLNKTSKLLMASMLSVSAKYNYQYFNELSEYSENLGYLFQITDDILDVEGTLSSIGKTPNKDAYSGKTTIISLFGLKKAKEYAKLHYNKCVDIISKLPNNQFLLELTEFIYKRNK